MPKIILLHKILTL